MTRLLTASLILLTSMLPVAAQEGGQPKRSVRKPRIADTVKANVYADNSFKLYINGELVAVDSIKFVPHNVVSVVEVENQVHSNDYFPNQQSSLKASSTTLGESLLR